MFTNHLPEDVFFMRSNDFDVDQQAEDGASWLRSQPGEGLVLLHAKQNIDNNPFLKAGTQGMTVASPATLHRSGWSSGPMLAAWPSPEVLEAIIDLPPGRVTALCILGGFGSADLLDVFLNEIDARDLISGKLLRSSELRTPLDPVVRAAMNDIRSTVNLNNRLLQAEDKAMAVETLRVLHKAGFDLIPDQLQGWALACSFGTGAKNLADYAAKVGAGKRIQLTAGYGPGAGALTRWEAEAAESSG